MKKRQRNKTRILNRTGAVLLSFFLIFSVFLPDVSVWAEEASAIEESGSEQTATAPGVEPEETAETKGPSHWNAEGALEEETAASEDAEAQDPDLSRTEELEEAGDTISADTSIAPEGASLPEEEKAGSNTEGPADWAELQAQINALYGAEESTIRLTADLTAGPEEAALHVPQGVKVIIDLNGHGIDRNRSNPEENGSVFINDSSLTIIDTAGGGTITGGKTTGDGGGIVNNSTLNLNGGTITGNLALGNGGGVYNTNAATMGGGTISGNEAGRIGGGVYNTSRRGIIISAGTITGNAAGENAGGVWFEADGYMALSGIVNITGNTVNGNANNLYIRNGAGVGFSASYSSESLIGITTEVKPEAGSAVTISKSNKGRSTAANFSSDDPAYAVFQEGEDEVKLVVPVTIRFEKGNDGAEGEMAPVTAGKGIAYTAPASGFYLEGSAFRGWFVNEDRETIVKAGEKIVPAGDTTLTAAWDASAWKGLQARIDRAADGETIVLDQTVTAAPDDSALRVPSGKSIILDLNGQTINRNLETPVSGGYVIRVEGGLMIRDSAGGGRITGGNDVSTGAALRVAGGILIDGGECILQSGTISGNRAQRGGGIFNYHGTLIMDGGTIENNMASSLGGGIDALNGTTYIRGGAIIHNTSENLAGGMILSSDSTWFSGNPVIKDNTAKSGAENVYVNTRSTLRIEGPLAEGAEIHVFHAMNDMVDEPVTVTGGLPGNAGIEAFVSDEGYYKGYDAGGELVFGKNSATVIFRSGKGAAEEEIENITWAENSYLILPECAFQPLDGYSFRGWEIGGTVYQPGEKVQITEDTVITAVMRNPWRELQEKIDAAKSNERITLSEDIIASPSDSPLVIGEGKVIQIDLNGFKLDRNLQSPAENGSVLINRGILIIRNTGGAETGRITGGNTTGDGGGIVNPGVLSLNGGYIAGNRAAGNGGGIYSDGRISMYSAACIESNSAGVSGGGIFINSLDEGYQYSVIMHAGTIRGNSAGVSGGGVYGNGYYHVSGDSRIESNTVSGGADNLFISAEEEGPRCEYMIDGLGENAYIGITSQLKPEAGSPVTVIKGLTAAFSAKGLYSDDPAYMIGETEDKEAQLILAHTVTFDKGNPQAEGEMAPAVIGDGHKYTLPDSAFTLEGEPFMGWMIDEDPAQTMAPGDEIVPEKDLKLTALWGKSPWKELQEKIDAAQNGECILLEGDVTALPLDEPLSIPAGKQITIDLQGHTIDRHLLQKNSNGAIMTVQGQLEITDSKGGGKLTGANNASTNPHSAGSVNVDGGTFILNGGSITGNWSNYSGAVHPAAGSTFRMTGGSIQGNSGNYAGVSMVLQDAVIDIRGGSITGNTSERNGAISMNGLRLQLSGNLVITGNTTNGKEYNVELRRSGIDVTAPLDESAKIGIYAASDGVITKGLPGRGVIENFISDNDKVMGYTADREAMIGPAVTISFDANGGSGTMDAVKVCKDSYYILPDSSFTAPAGSSFDYWRKGASDQHEAGEAVKIEKDTTFYADWKDARMAKLTIHWSSGDGADLTDPLVTRCAVGSSITEVIGAMSSDIRTKFRKEGYTAAEGGTAYGMFLPAPVSTYADMEAAGSAQITGGTISGDMELYYVLLKEQREIVVTLDPVTCGTDTNAAEPSVRAEEDAFSNLTDAFWIVSDRDRSRETKTLKGDETAYMEIVLKPKAGIAYSVRVDKVTAKGGEVRGLFGDHDSLHIVLSTGVTHIPGDVRKENERAATCLKAGGYDEIICCTQEICEHAQISSRFVETAPAMGHAWKEPVYQLSEDKKYLTAHRECEHQTTPACTESESVTIVKSEITKQPTCTENGETTYTAMEFPNPAFSSRTITLADIPATGHNWETPTYTWAEDHSTVTAERVCHRDPAHKETETAPTQIINEQNATCEADGERTCLSVFTNTAFEPQTKSEILPATGHRWDGGTVTKAATCTEDGVLTYTCQNDPSHRKEEAIPKTGHLPAAAVIENEKPATCTEAGGYDSVIYCTRCGGEMSRDHHTDPALGHEWGEWEVVKEATEKEEGLEERECGRCHQKEARVIPRPDHEHDMAYFEEIAATCTTAGCKAHYQCIDCKRYFLDPDGYHEAEWEDLNIDPKGHAKTERSEEGRTPATCTGDGYYYIVVRCTECGEAVSRTQVALPALGHDWDEAVYLWAEDNQTVTAHRSCKRCGEVQEETVLTEQEIVTRPTCTEMGSTKYTAVFTDPAYQTQTKTLRDISATGHQWDEGRVTKEATCEEAGTRLYTCLHDKTHTYTENIDPLGHSPSPEAIENMEPATCTESGGYDKVIVCERCGKELSRDHYIEPALGHRWLDWEVIKEAGPDEEGLEERACARCGEKESRVIPAWDHEHDMEEIAEKPATCMETGVKAHSQCKICKRYFFDPDGYWEAEPEDLILPLALHTIIRSEENRVAPTCTAPGHFEVVVSCEVCKTIISRTPVSQPKLGHQWGEAAYTWSEDKGSVTAVCTCERDPSHTLSETAVSASAITKQPTCTEKGERTYTADFANEVFETQTKTEDIEPTGHSWDSPVYRWAADNAQVTAERICLHDPTHLESETVKAAAEVTKEPTCTENGETTYTAEFENKAFETQTKTEEKAALGHDWSEWITVREATDDTDGLEERTCERCGNKETRSIPKPEEVSYRVVEGDESVWTRDSSEGLTLRWQRSRDDEKTYELFLGATVDGMSLDPASYTTEPGSLLLHLNPEYLQTLSSGQHEIQAFFRDGSGAKARFTVADPKKEDDKPDSDPSKKDGDKPDGVPSKKEAGKPGSKNPATGDHQPVRPFALCMLFALLVLTAAILRRRHSR